MPHLDPEDLIDLAEGTRPEGGAPHLASCESCRRQLADLRAMMSAAADVEIPEPSPLFWQHLSARVREAVSHDEASASASAWMPPWMGWRVAASVAGLAALVAAAALSLRMELPRPVVAPDVLPPHPAQVADATVGVNDVVSLADDASLGLIAVLAGDLDWDAAVEAGLATPAGAVDRAVLELSASERLELQRILSAELSRSGA
jgi:hypothetical protein